MIDRSGNHWRWDGDELGEAFKFLHGDCQQELIADASETTWLEPCQGQAMPLRCCISAILWAETELAFRLRPGRPGANERQ